jgi:Xaa-Pro aminopeptidase
MLTAAELNWLNAYQARVRDALASSVDAATRAWLITATAPLGSR